MPISFTSVMKSLIVLPAIALCSCSSRHEQRTDQPPVMKVDKPFAAAGTIDMQLDGGDYIVRAGHDEHIRVSFTGDPGNASAVLAANGAGANLSIKDTPHSDFRATIEVPARSDIAVHLTGGNLAIGAIAGSKEIDSKAGNVEISVSNAHDYATVDASVKIGDLNAGPFGDSASGLSPHLKWSGPGKYTLRADLGAGNLELKK